MTRHIRSPWARCSASVLVVAAATVGLAAVPAAAETAYSASGGTGAYPLHTGTLTTENRTSGLRPGSSLEVSGGGFVPGSTVQLTIRSAEIALGSVKADASGSFSWTVTLPAGLADGTHTIYATGPDPRGGTLVETLTITVDRGGRELAHTGSDQASVFGAGSDPAAWTAVGLGAFALTGTAVLAGRSRRRKHG